ncbi:MAG: DedA family protein, partial [Pseudomonadales bacterium]|nr:DedA family protein [Pseudomonadales bacterium]
MPQSEPPSTPTDSAAPDKEPAASRLLPVSRPHALRRLYDWVLLWAEHPHANWALFILAFAEASFFPIPPDVLLLAMAMGAPHRALRFAMVCTAGSVLGGIAGYAMGWGLWANVDTFFYQYVPGFSVATFDQLAQQFADNTFVTIFTAGFTPIPFKVFTIAAGAAIVPFGLFLAGAIISRALRFTLLAGLIMWLGPAVKLWIDRY